MNPLNPPPARPSGLQRSALVASLAERRWLIFVLLVILSLLSLMVFTALHWAAMPPSRVEKIDVRSVHLRGEFIESNLGTAQEASGRVVVRLVAQQYSFVPQCLVVPEKTPVTFRGTSTDAIHGFLIGKTNANTMLIPGFISTFTTSFEQQGEQLMPCHEYCGVGHEAMWAKVQVISREEFQSRMQHEERLNCVSR